MKTTVLSLLILICSMAVFPYASLAQEARPMVRLIYFLPSDREPQPDIDEKMDGLIKDVQQIYANLMEAHGFGRKTFQFETDARGNAVVHHIKGRFTDKHYSNLSNLRDVWEETGERFDTSKDIYLTAIDTISETVGGACGRGGSTFVNRRGGLGGGAHIPASGLCFNVGVTAHELGHAFGLHHDFRPDAKRIQSHISDSMITSFCAAEWLSVHRAFNSSRPVSSDEPFTAEMLPPSLASPPNVIRLRFKVTDPEGIHQVQLFGGGSYHSLLGCKRLNGNSNSTVEFVTPHLTPKSTSVGILVIDVHGNYVTGNEIYPINVTSLLPPPEVVSIPDANLAAAVRREIGNSITTHTILNLIQLEVPNRGITRLTGIEHAHNLNALNLGHKFINGELVNSNAISDFSPLFGLAQLTSLNLSSSSLSDVSFLENLTQLTYLDLYENTISDVSPLTNLTQLWSLNLSNNAISDISPLLGLTQLSRLNLSNNAISDVSPLAGLTQLRDLNFYKNTISDVSPLTNLTQLTYLDLYKNTISDVSPLTNLTQLPILRLGANMISDVSPLANLTQLTRLDLAHNAISDVSPLANLTQLTHLNLYNNAVSDVLPLAELNLTASQWDSTGLHLELNPLNYVSLHTHIPAMQAKGIEVKFDQRTYPALDIISGSGQQAMGSESVANPLVVAAIDAGGIPIRGISVTFTVIGGNGKLSTATATTDARGRAQTNLTLGPNPGRHRVQATAAALNSRILFIAIATAPVARLAADVNGDGVVNIQDLVIVSSHLGQDGQNVADVNGDGVVNIQDLVLVAGELGTEAAAPSAWHRTSGSVPPRATVEQWLTQAYRVSLIDPRSQRGVLLLERLLAALTPKETTLLANYPNPFNPETWIPYQLAEPAEIILSIYAVDGRVVRQLTLGHQPAGMYRNKKRAAYWDGRNEQGERVASGVYFYMLTAGDFSATQKMLIRK